jgi:phenylalanyl-tRNA synthetase beta chain
MNISYSWLNDLIDVGMSPSELATRLTSVGLTVEGVHEVGDDHILDIDLTSNRPDCLSHLGVAREVGVITGSKLKIADLLTTDDIPMPAVLAYDVVRIEAPQLCQRFTARVVRGVKIGRSPDWLVKRLEAVGERAINNVADITNYVMLELGQPMHSFDLDKLAENRIVVRRAKAGEMITTLDELERKLDESMLAICDAEKPVAVAGVMGGLDSAISDATTNVLLEVAYFDPASIRQTSRKLRLSTEASHRFERGVDIENLIRASNRATQLICEIAGGAADDLIDVYPTPYEPKEVESNDISYAVRRLSSLDVPTADCDRILSLLGIRKRQDTIYISPTWRHDIAIEEDLVEEVARHIGYDNIAGELPPAYGAGEYQQNETREKLLRQKLVDLGFNEAITYSFVDTGFDDTFEPVPGLIDSTGADERFVTLQDSVIEGAVRMRTTNLPGLLDAVRLNINHQRRDLKLFEIGKVFAARSDENGLPAEAKNLALVLTGSDSLEGRALSTRELDFYDVKGATEAAFEAVGIDDARFVASEVKHLRRGQSAAVYINETPVGYAGRLNDDVAAEYKFRQPIYVAELDLGSVVKLASGQVNYRPLPRFPSVVRDISFAAPRDVTFDAISSATRSADVDLCKNVEFVDVYEGKGLADNERSITIRLEYRSDERTLVEDEVDKAHDRIVSAVMDRLGVRVRT